MFKTSSSMPSNRVEATEFDPLFPGGHTHKKYPRRYYGMQYRYKKSIVCWVGTFALVIGTTVVVILVSWYLAKEWDSPGNSNATVSGSINFAPLQPLFLINLASLSWPIADKSISSSESPPSINVSANEISSALEEGLLMGLRRDEIERNLSSRKITIKTGSPPYFHHKFSHTHSRALTMAKQGYDIDCASKILAKRLNLTKHEVQPVFENLPTVQLIVGCSSTIHGNGTPIPECQSKMKYRKANGRCNNVIFPEWGSSFTALRRMLSPDYADGISAPRVSISGDPLPSARLVSSTVHTSDYKGDHKHSTHLTQWGQFIDHDITSTATSKDANGSAITCCNAQVLADPSLQHPECFAISIPSSDPFYSHFNQTCMEMVRSAPAPRCTFGKNTGNVGYRNQFNQLTSFIDGSTLYGSTEEEQYQLRSFSNGTLKSSAGENTRPLLPLTQSFVIRSNDSSFLDWAQTEANVFKSGDSRVNEQIMLTAMHTIWMREHNSIAYALANLNTKWSDEKIFQETRRIVIAEIQHITYNEFLPQILGEELMKDLKMLPKKDGYTHDYDSSINPTIANSFATAAYRFGHSQIQGVMKSSSVGGLSTSYTKLRDFFFNSFKLISPRMIDDLVSGQATMESRAVDRFFTPEVTNHLFETKNAHFGLDLVAVNTQRGRDHGLAGYRAWRKHCGLSEPMMFDDLLKIGWPKTMMTAVKKIYSSVDDIDLYTGGLGEPHLPGAAVGPTFACIIADQFLRLKRGDRYWYETSEAPQAFTEDQLTQLHSTSLARIFCDNVEGLEFIQPKVMEMPGRTNMPVRCSSGEFPTNNFSHWKQV